MGGTRFSALFQSGPAVHPASYVMCTGAFPGVKRPGRGADNTPQLATTLKKVCNYSILPLWVFATYFAFFTMK
jgi:hypothetical protein